MVQPPKDQDGSLFSKRHCKPQYKFPLIEKARFQFFYQKVRAAVVRSLQIEIPYPTASTREREKTGEKLVETAEKTPRSFCWVGSWASGVWKGTGQSGEGMFSGQLDKSHTRYEFFPQDSFSAFSSLHIIFLLLRAFFSVSIIWAYFGSCGVILEGRGAVCEQVGWSQRELLGLLRPDSRWASSCISSTSPLETETNSATQRRPHYRRSTIPPKSHTGSPRASLWDVEPRSRIQRPGRRGVSVRPGRRRGQWMLCGGSGSAGHRGWRPESPHKCSFSRGRDSHCLGDVFTFPLWSWLNKLMFISELPLTPSFLPDKDLIFRKCVNKWETASMNAFFGYSFTVLVEPGSIHTCISWALVKKGGWLDLFYWILEYRCWNKVYVVLVETLKTAYKQNTVVWGRVVGERERGRERETHCLQKSSLTHYWPETY